MATSPPRNRVLHWLLRAAKTLAVGYLLVLLVLLLLENWLLYPAPRYPEGDWQAAGLDHEEVEFASPDGTRLHGWLLEHPQPKAIVLYCHGNGAHVAYLAPHMKELREGLEATIFAFDYRGYGRSEGTPGEAGILEDSAAAQAWLAERTGSRPQDIVLMGRSLGGSVAVHLAAEHGARRLVLQNTFTSLPEVAARMYRWLPVRWLMKNRYDSLAKIGRYEGPLLASHGTRDGLVPLALGRELYDAAPGPKQFFTHDGGHNSPEPAAYFRLLRQFLHELPAAPLAGEPLIDTPHKAD